MTWAQTPARCTANRISAVVESEIKGRGCESFDEEWFSLQNFESVASLGWDDASTWMKQRFQEKDVFHPGNIRTRLHDAASVHVPKWMCASVIIDATNLNSGTPS